jgi:hypothetical protein
LYEKPNDEKSSLIFLSHQKKMLKRKKLFEMWYNIFVCLQFSSYLLSRSILRYHLFKFFHSHLLPFLWNCFIISEKREIRHPLFMLLFEHIRRYSFIHFPNYNPIIASCLPLFGRIFYSLLTPQYTILLLLAHLLSINLRGRAIHQNCCCYFNAWWNLKNVCAFI